MEPYVMFTELLDLERIDDWRFIARDAPDKGERLYGGQLLAQCMRAAALTLPQNRYVNSLHAYFLRPGNVDEQIDLDVRAVRDGRTFSPREVIASQAGKERFRVVMSHQIEESTPQYQSVSMPDVPPPESVSLTYNEFTIAMMGGDDWHGIHRPFDIRYINPPADNQEPVTEAQLMWMRILPTLGDEAGIHQCGLAYLADSSLIDHVMLPHGLRWQDPGFVGASLDHSMWFHSPCRADEWLLYIQNVEATGRGRGLSRGRFLAADGQLVATCMQEGLMRWTE